MAASVIGIGEKWVIASAKPPLSTASKANEKAERFMLGIIQKFSLGAGSCI